MNQLAQIATGFINDIVKREEDLHRTRIAICKQCPIYEESVYGPRCSARKYLNKETNHIQYIPCKDCVNGCGCLLNKKTRVRDAKCPLDKWEI